jgi:hypothetical protein
VVLCCFGHNADVESRLTFQEKGVLGLSREPHRRVRTAVGPYCTGLSRSCVKVAERKGSSGPLGGTLNTDQRHGSLRIQSTMAPTRACGCSGINAWLARGMMMTVARAPNSSRLVPFFPGPERIAVRYQVEHRRDASLPVFRLSPVDQRNSGRSYERSRCTGPVSRPGALCP